MLRNSSQSWGSVAIALHWLLALLIFVQMGLGWVAVLWRLSPTKLDLFVWHKSVGMLMLALIIVRIAWRLLNPTPSLPPTTPQWEAWAARSGHMLLYLIMVGLPLSGWLINSAANVPFRIFWRVPLPDIVGPDEAVEAASKQAHLVMFIVLAVVVTLHVAAALRHHFWLRDDVLVRMLPLLRLRS